MIECSLRDQKEYGKLLPDWGTGKTKKGRYHGSSFAVEGFGFSCWAIGVYINVEHSRYTEDGMTDEQVLEGCVEYLNQPPPRKKYQKKKPQPRYGILSPYRGKVIERDGKKTLSALLITESRKNKLFWSEGKNVPARKKS